MVRLVILAVIVVGVVVAGRWKFEMWNEPDIYSNVVERMRCWPEARHIPDVE